MLGNTALCNGSNSSCRTGAITQASLQKERVVFELLRFEAPVGSAAQLIKRPILNSFLDTAKIISGQKPYKAAILDAKTDSRPRQSGRSLSRGF